MHLVKDMNFLLLIAVLLIGQCNCDQTNRNKNSLENAGTAAINNKGIEMNSISSEDYDPIPIDQLIGISDLIAQGTITDINDSTFSFRITKPVKGADSLQQIEVKQFHPGKFEGRSRLIPYKIDQSYILFLRNYIYPIKTNKQWQILGIGGEGEMPVFDNYVYFPNRNVEILSYGDHKIYDVNTKIQRLTLKLFIDAVREYPKCFIWRSVEKNKNEIATPFLICEKPMLDNYVKSSAFHKYLAESSLRRISK